MNLATTDAEERDRYPSGTTCLPKGAKQPVRTRATKILVGTACAAALMFAVPATAQTESNAAPTPPNVVVIMTDDQRADEMWAMPLTRMLLGERGTTFTNSFATYPLCCPSRTTLLTGQYMHNHGVRHNSPPDGGFDAHDFSNSLGVWLQKADYRTAHIGKMLNGYGVRYNADDPSALLDVAPTPPGYDDWFATIDPTSYQMYETVVQDNGVIRPLGVNQHSTDGIADRAIDDIHKWAPSDRPFFLSVQPVAPHSEAQDPDGGPRASTRNEGRFADHPFTPDPSFDEADVSDKPSLIRQFPRFTEEEKETIAQRERDRLEALQDVDELVARVVAALERTGELDNTVIVFTSDNGWFNGEHRGFSEKVAHYEPSSRVPLIIRGPGFPAGVTRSQMVANIDLAPTIVALSGAQPQLAMDGESLLPYAADPRHRQGRAIALEASFPEVSGFLAIYGKRYAGINIFYEGVRTERYKYIEWYKDVDGKPAHEEELYDLKNDPHELESLHADDRYANLKAKLKSELDALRTCKAQECVRTYR